MPVVVERDGRVTIVRLARAEKRNAMDPVMTEGLDAALNAFEDDPTAWVAILTGGDDVFSAGSDLRHGSGDPTPRGGEYGIIRRRHVKPLIAAVEGSAFGGGMEIVLSCDLVVASRSARFGLPEVKRGLFALYGGVFRSARALPLHIAKEMVLTGDPISAERAERFGFVNVLCDDGRAVDEARALAARIVANGPIAVRESLKVLEGTVGALDAVGWNLTAQAARAVFASPDAIEGRNAFLERRVPEWRDG